jgi:uncharacterized repeat protein (TIGR01451 family)
MEVGMSKKPFTSKRVGRISYRLISGLLLVALMLAATQLIYGVGGVFATALLTASKSDALVVDADNSSNITPGDTLEYTVVIQNTGSSDAAGAAFSDTLDSNTTLAQINGSNFISTPIARNDSYSTVGNVLLTVPVGQGVLLNDDDPDGTGALTISSFPTNSANSGNVTLNPDGSFTYNPPAGFSGVDTFTYAVQDTDGNSDSASVSISVSPVVWFINNTAGGPGDGRFTSPFNSVANFNSLAADDPGDYIFIYQGSGAYAGAITLLNNQQLIGHGVGLTVSPNLSIVAASRPTISNVTLGSGNTVRGLNITAASGTALSGGSVGTLTINNVSVTNTSGAGVSLSSGALAVTLDSVSATGGVNGIYLSNNGGSFTVNGGVIQNSTGHAIQVANSSAGPLNFTLQNSIITNAAVGFNGINFEVPFAGTGSFGTVTVTGNTISNNGSTGLRANIQGSGSIGKIDIGSNTFSGNGVKQDFGVDLSTNGTASIDFDVHNNATMSGDRTQVNINSQANSMMEGYIRNNTITLNPADVGIAIWVVGEGNGLVTVDINNNTITGFGDSGIDVEARGGTGDVYARIINNSATTTATFPLAGMYLRSGNGTVGETSLLCVNASNNNMNGGAGAVADYYLDRFSPTTTLFQIQGLSPAAATPSQAEAFIVTTDSAPPATAFAENGTYTAATCNTVSFASVPGNQPFAAQEAEKVSSEAAAKAIHGVLAVLNQNVVHFAKELISTWKVSTAYASGETINATLGTLNPGQTVTLTFRATINAAVPGGTSQVCNQGTFTASGGINGQTDDPDAGGAADPTCTLLADGVPPDTSITTMPLNPSSDSTPTFAFTGTDNLTPAGSLTFECQVDSGGFIACTSPYTTLTLSDGPHTFQVRAKDAAGNTDPTPASNNWTIDATPPSVTINQASGQADPTSDSPINFTVVFSEPVSGFGNNSADVTLTSTAGTTTAAVTEIAPSDGTTYKVAVSGMTANGTVSASIPAGVANDAAGNINNASSSTDNSVTFVADNTPPDTVVLSGPTNPNSSTSASFTFSGTDNPGGSGTASFECQLDSGAFSACASPTSYSGLSQGSHTFQVRATDAAGNTDPTPASYAWLIDTTPPDTTILSNPSNPSSSTSAAFTFSGTDLGGSGVASFDCKLDSGAFSACASPISYSSLSLGSHTFQVRASDLAGNLDPTPASYTWDVHASTSMLYNGVQIVNVGSSFQPAAKLSSSVSACVSSQSISFSLDDNPLVSGSQGSYSLGAATTNSSGQATLASIVTTPWLEGIYEITATFAGTASCDPSTYTATLTVASPGNSATGGGWYTLSGSGRNNFGFAVRKVDNKCLTNCAYKGQVLFMNNGKWRLKGTLTSYSKLATGQGAASGVGTLYWWDTSLNGGLGDWVIASPNVNFTINFFDSNKNGKASTDTFGINIQYLPVAPPQPNNLPNSTPTLLKGGDIKVQ